jgi:carbonic anhydrase/acetyltransferase-like protein (isoleucine patch superfamily)
MVMRYNRAELIQACCVKKQSLMFPHRFCVRRTLPNHVTTTPNFMIIKSILGKTPQFGENVFLAENATIVGDVVMGNDCSIWFTAVVRGDVNSIKIGDRVNIQDGAIIHGTFERAPTTIGDNVSIGHRAIIHGCTIESNVLIGMGAIVMDHTVVHSNSIVAAGAIVLENSIVESNSIYAGVPARKVKTLEPGNEAEIQRIAQNYQKYASWYQDS